MSKKHLVFVVVAWVVIFAIGLGAGFVLRSQTKTEIIKEKKINNLASKVVSSIAVYGKIVKIQGRDLTLSNLGDDLTITLADKAQIFVFKVALVGKDQTPVQQVVKLENVKVGDSANAVIKILDNGQLQGLSLVILPSTN